MTSKIAAALLCALTFAVAARATQAPSAPPPPPLTPVAALDVKRYMGDWYEIAKFPNWFQRNCAGDTRASYTLRPDGGVVVDNRCRRANGEIDSALGAARQLGPADSPRLEVRFAPAWLSFIPLVWADYWVIDIDDAYQLVAVSEPRRKYLWILSRTPQVDPQAYAALKARLSARGFDLGQLEPTPQSIR